MLSRFVPLRVRVAIHVLRGRPTIYRIVGSPGLAPDNRNVLVADNTLVNVGPPAIYLRDCLGETDRS